MGYTTDFVGRFDLDRTLTPEHAAYLHKFCRTRRMQRDAAKTATREDPVREAVNLPVGVEGGYFVGETGFAGQGDGFDVLNHNGAPAGQPGLWAQWVPTEDLTGIEWDGGEKFYCYVEWLDYIITHFLAPWGYVLNGSVTWEGESSGDTGTLLVVDNVVTAGKGALNLLAQTAEDEV